MDDWLKIIITVAGSVLASSGLWTFITLKMNKKDASHSMLVALGHDRIMALGTAYVKRNEITPDEIENIEMLYVPYEKMGGNGSAKRMMEAVHRLPVVDKHGV